MVILNIFGEMEEITVSKKLGITVSNLTDDWKDGIKEDIKEEIYLREFEVKKYIKYSPKLENYNLSEILGDAYYDGIFNIGVNDDENIDEISKKLVCIQIGDFENSLLTLKNKETDNPTWEDSFEYKFIQFFQFLSTYNMVEKERKYNSPLCVYHTEKTGKGMGILRSLVYRFGKNERINHSCFFNRQIADLIKFGEILDNYLESAEDFLELDYLIDAIYRDISYNAYHLFKFASLIEMLIINPNTKGKTCGELESKLPAFLADNQLSTEEEKRQFCTMIRVIRNKIGHGDFKQLHKKLEEYAGCFMKNCWFDYYEYSHINWIYLNLGCALNRIVSNIIWKKLIHKQEMIKLKNS